MDTRPFMVTANWRIKAIRRPGNERMSADTSTTSGMWIRSKPFVANQDADVTFFCGGSRNFAKFIHLFDGVFVLDVDLDTLNRRLDERPDSDWGGGKPVAREFIVRLHRTREDIPKDGILIDATAPIADVVDEILRQAMHLSNPTPSRSTHV